MLAGSRTAVGAESHYLRHSLLAVGHYDKLYDFLETNKDSTVGATRGNLGTNWGMSAGNQNGLGASHSLKSPRGSLLEARAALLLSARAAPQAAPTSDRATATAKASVARTPTSSSTPWR